MGATLIVTKVGNRLELSATGWFQTFGMMMPVKNQVTFNVLFPFDFQPSLIRRKDDIGEWQKYLTCRNHVVFMSIRKTAQNLLNQYAIMGIHSDERWMLPSLSSSFSRQASAPRGLSFFMESSYWIIWINQPEIHLWKYISSTRPVGSGWYSLQSWMEPFVKRCMVSL